MARRALNEDERRISGRVAYYEPLRPASVLMKEARRLRYEALIAERTGAHSAESAYREAIERFVDAFLVDRAGHADCFTQAHVVGRHVAERFGCPMTASDDGYWHVDCGVLALHQRLGTSYAGLTLGRCSVCGASDLGCDHVPRSGAVVRRCPLPPDRRGGRFA